MRGHECSSRWPHSREEEEETRKKTGIVETLDDGRFGRIGGIDPGEKKKKVGQPTRAGGVFRPDLGPIRIDGRNPLVQVSWPSWNSRPCGSDRVGKR